MRVPNGGTGLTGGFLRWQNSSIRLGYRVIPLTPCVLSYQDRTIQTTVRSLPQMHLVRRIWQLWTISNIPEPILTQLHDRIFNLLHVVQTLQIIKTMQELGVNRQRRDRRWTKWCTHLHLVKAGVVERLTDRVSDRLNSALRLGCLKLDGIAQDGIGQTVKHRVAIAKCVPSFGHSNQHIGTCSSIIDDFDGCRICVQTWL